MKEPCLIFLAAIALAHTAHSATTISPTNCQAWGANFGWMDARGDTANGAVIGEYVCSGSIWAANIGWISLGSGFPTNGIQYQNLSADDFGVNLDAVGNLRGYAWGANIGWVNFEATGAPKVDLATGRISGYAYSANCGWLSFSNALTCVQTDRLAAAPDSDGDGMADAWERTQFGNLTTATASSDYDGDGLTDLQEYQAGTSPLDANDNLRITLLTRSGTYNTVWWASRPNRFYRLERRLALSPASPWETYLSFDSLGWNNVGFDSTSTQYFYRVQAVRPLMP